MEKRKRKKMEKRTKIEIGAEIEIEIETVTEIGIIVGIMTTITAMIERSAARNTTSAIMKGIASVIIID